MSDAPQHPQSTPPPPPYGGGAPIPPNPNPNPPPPGSQPSGPPPSPGQAPYGGPPAPSPYGGYPQQFVGARSKDDATMAMLVHVLLLFTGFIGPLIIWLMKKDESPFVDRHGKTALNFSFTLAIASFVTILLCFVLIGFLLLPVLLVVGFVFPIIAAMAANKGEEYTYPMSIKFFS